MSIENISKNAHPDEERGAEDRMTELQRVMTDVRYEVLTNPEFSGKKFVFIMRGVPGSGKSTVACEIAHPDGVVHSTDSYFEEDGEYKFDPTKLEENHEKNFQAFLKSMSEEKPIVVVDNTNIKRGHFEKYINAAKEAGYVVREISLSTPDLKDAVERNTHGVSQEIIKRMMDEYEK